MPAWAVKLIPCIVALVVLSTAIGGHPRSAVLPIQAHAFGKTYANWSAAWWQWALSIPADNHPLTDTADVSTGQKGAVWFLGGYFGSTTAARHCTIPPGKALFFPILNVECSTVEPPPFFGADEEELRANAKAFVDPATDLFAEVDGVSIQNLDQYRTQSPLFSFDAPQPNVLGVAGPIQGESVSDGYYLLIPPLPVGEHTIHFGGTFPQFNFTIDVTYHITVSPAARH
jgi:hypothetical protein